MGMNEKIIKEGICVEITQDKMLGIISFTQPENGGEKLSLHEVEMAIKEKGITHGIKREDLNEIYTAHEYAHKYIIAQGKAPIHGKDGRIEFNFDRQALKSFKPKLNGDGTVDLKDLDAVKNVKQGEHLATKIPSTKGEEGFNVLGQVLKAQKGKNPRMPRGRNTTVLEDEVTLVADIDGKLEYDDYNIYVNSVYTINGDLDNSIGNVDFIGSVVINGSIHSGYSVNAGGSVEVKGPVEDAVIKAGADIVLNYGIQGTNKSKLIAKGNIVAKYIQNTCVEAGGTIVTEAILHSNVTAGDSILVELGKGSIVGGSASASNLIVAQSIGSPMGTVTALQIGVSPSVYAEYKQLGEEMKEKKACISKIDQSIKFLINKMQDGRLSAQHQDMFKKFNATRKPIVEEYEEIEERYIRLSEQLSNIKEGTIRCTGIIYTGVKITFGNLIKYIDSNHGCTIIRKEDGDIKLGI